MFELEKPTPLQQIYAPLFLEKGVEVFLKREDLIDVDISGNKWRKLKYNLIQASELGFQKILTFGGAYSNHIAATAAACKRFGFESVGIIRGEELNANSNPTLRQATEYGMNLKFITRSDYQHRDDKVWINDLSEKYQAFVVPEGGSNEAALKGVKELVDEIDINFDYILCPIGTGGTLAGIIQGLVAKQKALGISCLKGEGYLEQMVQGLTKKTESWALIHNYHFGGYARFDSHLIGFINQFYEAHGIPLDPIYTGKMMYGFFDLLKKGKFPDGSRVICVHTGGLQGIAGFNAQHNDLLKT
ncbi:1-aminocyclopropane-1-carboxylate deaminase [Reichenbachiella faecimaris]|uniref:1-aminocyclopropane-1-carboxylate deaminase n=1 Tax=Reichenbachiella faecimaris TaxID=692418 RepID=A0A1W2GI02_REIFA|nr:pyridoxal-phosphate dependent enzyme [Reichenbachiella faecimaris]SMD36201.1 1-aminocyclopropane-1-carboxylate deaminase [Reichenbachiella faecimaris]